MGLRISHLDYIYILGNEQEFIKMDNILENIQSLSIRKTYTVLLLSIFLIISNSCAALSSIIPSGKPELSLERIEFRSLEANKIKLRAVVVLDNPFPITIPSSNFTGRISIQSVPLTEWELPVENIRALSSIPLNIDFEIPFSALSGILNMNLENVERIPVKLEGSVALDTSKFTGKTKLPNQLKLKFNEQIDIPAIYPEVNIVNFSMGLSGGNTLASLGGVLTGSGSDSEIQAVFDLILTNRAGAEFQAENLSYGFKLNGRRILSGEAMSVENLGRTSILRIRSGIPIANLGLTFVRSLSGGSAKYDLEGGANFGFPGFSLPSIKYNFDKTGDLKW